MKVNVSSNVDRVRAEFRADSRAVKTATYRALNRSIDASVTGTSREIRKIYNIKDRAVKVALSKVYANRHRLAARMTIEGAKFPLIEFDARWRQGQKGGATVKVKVAGGRKVVKGAFIAEGRMGRGVFRRVGKARLPIRHLRAISVPQAFENDQVEAAVKAIAVAAFEKNFQQQLKFLSGGGGGGP